LGLLQLLVPVEHLLLLPSTGVLPKLVDQAAPIDPLQDLPFVVISAGDRGGLRAQPTLVCGQSPSLQGTWGHSPHRSAQLLVGHAAVLLLLPPELSHRLGAQELEDALTSVLPLHQPLVQLGVDQDVTDELPQMSSSWG